MDWKKMQKHYDLSFVQDVDIKKWANTKHNVSIKRCQEWDAHKAENFFISSDMNIKDIYLDYSVISEGWHTSYGIPLLKDFVKPVSTGGIKKRFTTVKKRNPWRVYAGKDECQWMHPKILEVLDVVMRYICSLYPRECNTEFVLGDAGCKCGMHCSGHGGAHDNLSTIDLNYCTLKGFNMTHYRNSIMPTKYNGTDVNIWRDRFPMRLLRKGVFDTEKNYALYCLLREVFPDGSFMTSSGLETHFKKVYGSSVLQGDDIEPYNHFRHVHLYLRGEVNWDTEIRSHLPEGKI